MYIMKKLFFIAFILHFFFNLHGQEVLEKYPVWYSQYMNCFPMINPASISVTDLLQVSTGVQRNVGFWSDYSDYFAIVSYKPRPTVVKNNGSTFSMRFAGDKEGVYLYTSRLYGAYAWHTRVSEEFSFAGGMELGVINYSIKGTYSTGNRSTLALDGNVGLWFYSKHTHLGVSANQVLNSRMQPFNEVSILSSYYSLTAGNEFIVSDFFSIKPIFVYTIYKAFVNDFDINMISKTGNLVLAGTGYRANKGLMFLVGVQNIYLGRDAMTISLAYNMPVMKNVININTLEFFVSYMPEKNK